MGYHAGVLVPGNCEDAPCCGHNDTEGGYMDCPQPPYIASEFEDNEEEARDGYEAPLFADCTEALTASNELPEDYCISNEYFGKTEEGKTARKAWKVRCVEFNAENTATPPENFKELLALEEKHNVTLEFYCGVCCECYANDQDMEAMNESNERDFY